MIVQQQHIKTIFCSYRGVLIVYDVNNNRVNELCGEINIEKVRKIEELANQIEFEFNSIKNYQHWSDKVKKETERKPIMMISRARGVGKTYHPPAQPAYITTAGPFYIVTHYSGKIVLQTQSKEEAMAFLRNNNGQFLVKKTYAKI